MVSIPAVMEAGAETRFCVSLLQSTETVDMTVTLMSNVENTTLLKQSTDKDLHQCISFTVSSHDRKYVHLEIDEVKYYETLGEFCFYSMRLCFLLGSVYKIYFYYSLLQCRIQRCRHWRWRYEATDITQEKSGKSCSKPIDQ